MELTPGSAVNSVTHNSCSLITLVRRLPWITLKKLGVASLSKADSKVWQNFIGVGLCYSAWWLPHMLSQGLPYGEEKAK